MTASRRFPIPTRYYPRRRIPRPRPSLLSRPSARAALAVLIVILPALGLGPLLLEWEPNVMQVDDALRPPGSQHWLGTDRFGRDVLSRLLHGGRVSVVAGLASVAAALVVGSALGIAAGYWGGVVDEVLSGVANVLLAFPGLLLALVFSWLLGRGVEQAAIGVAIAGVPTYVRVARAQVRQVSRTAYIRAAHAVGVPPFRILLRHVLPNAVVPLLTVAALNLGWAIVQVSALSFLGVGARPPQAEWGLMLSEARAYVRQAPWLGLAPGAAIALTVMSSNLLADAVEESLSTSRHSYLRLARG